MLHRFTHRIQPIAQAAPKVIGLGAISIGLALSVGQSLQAERSSERNQHNPMVAEALKPQRSLNTTSDNISAATAAQAKADAPGAKEAAKRAASSAKEQANKAQAEALAAREAEARTSHEAMEAVRQAKTEKLSAQKAAEVEAAEGHR